MLLRSVVDMDDDTVLIVDVSASCCPKCGSSEREPYHNVKTRHIEGFLNGKPFNRVSWKRTKCTVCNQQRIDRVYWTETETSELRKTDTLKTDAASVNSKHGKRSSTKKRSREHRSKA